MNSSPNNVVSRSVRKLPGEDHMWARQLWLEGQTLCNRRNHIVGMPRELYLQLHRSSLIQDLRTRQGHRAQSSRIQIAPYHGLVSQERQYVPLGLTGIH